MSTRTLHTLNILLEQNDLKGFEEVNDALQDIVHTPGYNILLTRYCLKNDDVERAISLLGSSSRKRQLQLVVEYLIEKGQTEVAYELFITHIPRFEVSGEDIIPFFATTYGKVILERYVGQSILFDLPSNTDFKGEMIDRYKQEERSVTFSYIVDGANVLMNESGKVTSDSYERLKSLTKKISNLCIVIPSKHMTLALLKLRCVIMITPPGVNDDLYIINLGITNDCKIITNDKFRDHIFTNKSQSFKDWVADKTVSYVFKNNQEFVLNERFESRCIQKVDGVFYLPTKSGMNPKSSTNSSGWFKVD